jgi:hypothetical protein
MLGRVLLVVALPFGTPRLLLSQDNGQGSSSRFNTFHDGHPRKVTADMLSLSIQGRRSAPINVEVADAPEHFTPYTARKRMYATGWDGTVKIRATADRSFIVTRNQ